MSQHLVYLASNVAPHASTTRSTYTVPTGKKARVDAISGEMMIKTAAGPAAERRVLFGVVVGGTAYYAGIMSLCADKNTVGNISSLSVGSGLLMLVGQVSNIVSTDESTGGTLDYRMSILITEYDT